MPSEKAFFEAVEAGDVGVVQACLADAKLTHAVEPKNRDTALILACDQIRKFQVSEEKCRPYYTIVEKLITAKAPLDAKNNDNNTALKILLEATRVNPKENGREEALIKMFCQNGATVEEDSVKLVKEELKRENAEQVFKNLDKCFADYDQRHNQLITQLTTEFAAEQKQIETDSKTVTITSPMWALSKNFEILCQAVHAAESLTLAINFNVMAVADSKAGDLDYQKLLAISEHYRKAVVADSKSDSKSDKSNSKIQGEVFCTVDEMDLFLAQLINSPTLRNVKLIKHIAPSFFKRVVQALSARSSKTIDNLELEASGFSLETQEEARLLTSFPKNLKFLFPMDVVPSVDSSNVWISYRFLRNLILCANENLRLHFRFHSNLLRFEEKETIYRALLDNPWATQVFVTRFGMGRDKKDEKEEKFAGADLCVNANQKDVADYKKYVTLLGAGLIGKINLPNLVGLIAAYHISPKEMRYLTIMGLLDQIVPDEVRDKMEIQWVPDCKLSALARRQYEAREHWRDSAEFPANQDVIRITAKEPVVLWGFHNLFYRLYKGYDYQYALSPSDYKMGTCLPDDSKSRDEWSFDEVELFNDSKFNETDTVYDPRKMGVFLYEALATEEKIQQMKTSQAATLCYYYVRAIKEFFFEEKQAAFASHIKYWVPRKHHPHFVPRYPHRFEDCNERQSLTELIALHNEAKQIVIESIQLGKNFPLVAIDDVPAYMIKSMNNNRNLCNVKEDEKAWSAGIWEFKPTWAVGFFEFDLRVKAEDPHREFHLCTLGKALFTNQLPPPKYPDDMENFIDYDHLHDSIIKNLKEKFGKIFNKMFADIDELKLDIKNKAVVIDAIFKPTHFILIYKNLNSTNGFTAYLGFLERRNLFSEKRVNSAFVNLGQLANVLLMNLLPPPLATGEVLDDVLKNINRANVIAAAVNELQRTKKLDKRSLAAVTQNIGIAQSFVPALMQHSIVAPPKDKKSDEKKGEARKGAPKPGSAAGKP